MEELIKPPRKGVVEITDKIAPPKGIRIFVRSDGEILIIDTVPKIIPHIRRGRDYKPLPCTEYFSTHVGDGKTYADIKKLVDNLTGPLWFGWMGVCGISPEEFIARFKREKPAKK